MNNKTDFSLDVTVNPASTFKPVPELVTFDLCKAYPVPGGNVLLRNSRTGQRAMVQPEVYASLLSCNAFRTLDKHVANIIATNPGMQGQQADIRQVLQSMLDSGMMIPAKDVCDALKHDTAQAGKPVDNKPVVAVITWERPASLERLLKSIKTNCASEKFHHLYVVDDSRNDANIIKNREITAKFAFELKSPVQYFGQSEQQSLLKSLARQLPEHEDAIRFLADQGRWRDHWTSGLARNLALLLSCGRRLVMLDDDTICDVYEPGQLSADISISDSARQADFFSHEREWIPNRQPINPDPIDRHMQCLGLKLSDALDVLGKNNLKPAGLTSATALQVSELESASPILVTECGSLGCPGINRNNWLPDMAPESLERMLASGQKTANALNTRLVWAGRNQPHFSPRPNMSQITGFDNREMLPPYLPILRGEDRLFGYMLDFIYPASVTLDYPWSIPHLPMPAREWLDEDRDFTPGPSFPLYFSEQLPAEKYACMAAEKTERLNALAAWFSDLGAASAETLRSSHQDAVLRDTTEQLKNLSDLQATAESAPNPWQDYLEQGIQQLSTALDRDSGTTYPIAGLPESMQEDELINFWKETWSDFAAALNAWPEIREVAAEILQAH